MQNQEKQSIIEVLEKIQDYCKQQENCAYCELAALGLCPKSKTPQDWTLPHKA